MMDTLTDAAEILLNALDSPDRDTMHRMILAACFGAERFDQMTAKPITHDGAPVAMLRATLVAVINPEDRELDDLRACNQGAV